MFENAVVKKADVKKNTFLKTTVSLARRVLCILKNQQSCLVVYILIVNFSNVRKINNSLYNVCS